MDIQVLNEIANPARQASLSQVGASVSANAQLKALKGNPVPAPGNPASPPFEDSPEQIQDPVTPEISSVARAASAYSAAVGDGLNSDELNAIQDLAGRVRTAVSDFLSQPGLGQAENAAAVVASNPEAVQDLTASVEQAVVETLSLPEVEDEVIVNAAPPNEEAVAEVPVPENFISVERITNGAEPNNQVVAASPALQNAQAREHTDVDNPVTVAASSETPTGDFRVTPASPALQNANPQSAVVENPANAASAPASPREGLTVVAASPALQNAQAGEHARTETPASRPDAVFPSSQGQASEGVQAQTVNPEGPVASPEGASSQTASGPSNLQPASGPQPGPAPSSDLFAQENAAVNPENIRNANELVNSVVDNEFTSEAKKIFSQPKVIRTVADLADFILERLREIIAAKQQQSQSSNRIGIS